MTKFAIILDDNGQHGGDTAIEAASMDEAKRLAAEWAKEGVWDEERTITLKLWQLDAAHPDYPGNNSRIEDSYDEHSVRVAANA